MSKSNNVANLVVIALGIFVTFYSYYILKLGILISPDAGFMPFLCGMALIVLGIVWRIQSMIFKSPTRVKHAGEPSETACDIKATPLRASRVKLCLAFPLLEKKGVDLFVYYVASAEIFDLLPRPMQERMFPEEHAKRAMGITGFTLPTMYRWIRSDMGRRITLHPFRKGHYLGSGQAHMVLREAGLDGKSQFKAIMKYLEK